MKVLAVIDAIELSGPGKGLLQLAQFGRALGIKIIVANFTYSGRRSLFNEAADERGVLCIPLDARARFERRIHKQLVALVENQGVDIIQSHSFKPHLYGWLLRRRTNLPWIAFAHGWTQESWRTRVNNAIERRMLARPDHVIALSQLLAEDLKAHGRALPTSIVMNAIPALPAEVTIVDRREARAALSIDDDAFVIACVGRLSFEKGQDVLLRAAADLKSDPDRPAILLLAGDGLYRQRFEDLSRRLAGDVKVRFLGNVTDVNPLYLASDLVVMPSRSEGTPNALLEAMSFGRPIVATRVGSVPSMVCGGREALLVPPENPAAITAQIQRVYDDPHLAEVLGRAARSALWPRFSAVERASRIHSIYQSILSSARKKEN